MHESVHKRDLNIFSFFYLHPLSSSFPQISRGLCRYLCKIFKKYLFLMRGIFNHSKINTSQICIIQLGLKWLLNKNGWPWSTQKTCRWWGWGVGGFFSHFTCNNVVSVTSPLLGPYDFSTMTLLFYSHWETVHRDD